MTLRLCFVRVPKTASTSIMASLAGKKLREPYFEYCAAHKTVQEFSQHDHDHEYITMIRNPYQQYISFYHHMKRVMAEPDWHTHDLTPERNPLAFQPHYQANEDLLLGGATVDEWLEQCTPNQFFHFYYSLLSPLDMGFVGVQEEMEKSYAVLRAKYDIRSVTEQMNPVNVNPDKLITDTYEVTYPESDFMIRNSLDYEVYELGKQRFAELCVDYL
jgi:hypothetical protein